MPTQVHNPTLKAKLRSLAMRALPFLDELVSTGRIPSGYRAGAEVIIGGYMTGPLPHVRAMREFQACKEQMNATPAIHNLFKAIVGTTSDVQATAGGADICLTMFIRRLFSAGSAFDPAIFDTHYEAFEELFYSTRFRYRQRVRLFWFDCEVDEIELSSGVVVKRLPPSSREAENLWVYQARGLKPYSMSDFILEWTGDVNKLSMISPATVQAHDEDRLKGEELFDDVIRCMHLLKPSTVCRDVAIITEPLTFHPLMSPSSGGIGISNLPSGATLLIGQSDVDELREAFSIRDRFAKGRFRVAVNRLGDGNTRQAAEDKLIDFMIGLEALYLPDGGAELSFRLAVRVAWTLSTTRKQRIATYRLIRAMYDARGKIVHGNIREVPRGQVAALGELLRRSLKLWLREPKAFTVDSRSGSGKLTEEGQLDQIIFGRTRSKGVSPSMQPRAHS